MHGLYPYVLMPTFFKLGFKHDVISLIYLHDWAKWAEIALLT